MLTMLFPTFLCSLCNADEKSVKYQRCFPNIFLWKTRWGARPWVIHLKLFLSTSYFKLLFKSVSVVPLCLTMIFFIKSPFLTDFLSYLFRYKKYNFTCLLYIVNEKIFRKRVICLEIRLKIIPISVCFWHAQIFFLFSAKSRIQFCKWFVFNHLPKRKIKSQERRVF